MPTADKKNNNQYLVRLIATTICIIIVMFLARAWFFPTGEQKKNTGTHSAISKHTEIPAEKPVRDPEIAVISWQQADKHYGEYVTVEGRIVATHNSGKACFLNFHPNWKVYFTAVIFKSSFSRFPDSPETYYQGKKVRITGAIKKYKGKPEIILNDPGQIEVIN